MMKLPFRVQIKCPETETQTWKLLTQATIDTQCQCFLASLYSTFPTMALVFPIQRTCCCLLLYHYMQVLGWPAHCLWVPRVGEVPCCSHGSLPQLPGRMTAMLWHRLGSPLTSPPTEAEAFLSYCAAWHMSLKLQGLCNINHQSSFLTRAKKASVLISSSCCSALSETGSAHARICLVSSTMVFAGCLKEICPFPSEQAITNPAKKQGLSLQKVVFIFTNHLSENHQVCNLKLHTSKMARWTSQFETKWGLIPGLHRRSNYDFICDLKTN